jgi:hypothetical protein
MSAFRRVLRVHFFWEFTVTVNNGGTVNARIRNALWNVLSQIADEVDVEPPGGTDGTYKACMSAG